MQPRPSTELSAALLLFVFGRGNGLEVFGLEDLAAIDAFHIVHAVSTGKNYGIFMLAGGLHKSTEDTTYFNDSATGVKGVGPARVLQKRGLEQLPSTAVSKRNLYWPNYKPAAESTGSHFR